LHRYENEVNAEQREYYLNLECRRIWISFSGGNEYCVRKSL